MSIFLGALVLVAPITLGYLILLAVIFSRLRRFHAAAFQDLGEPSFLFNNSISHGVRVVRFLVHRDYRALADSGLNRLGDICRALLLGAVALLVVAFLAVIAHGVVFAG
jgi:hypothetical protein